MQGIVRGGRNDSSVLTGNLIAADLLNGKTGYSNDPLTKVTGTMPLLGSEVYAGWKEATYFVVAATTGRVHLRIPLGAYLVGNAEQEGQLGIYYDDDDFIAGNIISGKDILGLMGTALRVATGTVAYTANGTTEVLKTISGLAFRPKFVYDYADGQSNAMAIRVDTGGFGNFAAGALISQCLSIAYLNYISSLVLTNDGFTVGTKSITVGDTNSYAHKWVAIG